MLARIVFAVAASLATAAVAGAPKGPVNLHGVIATPGGLAIATRPPTRRMLQIPLRERGLTTIFNNLANRYPDGVYWCCTSAIISGTASEFGAQSWIAASFTPAATLTVSKIVLGLSVNSGTNTLVVTLNRDDGGLPGSELASTSVSNMPRFPNCCAVAQAKGQGVPVSAGQQYWIVVKTKGRDSNTFGGWNFNDTEQVTPTGVAANDGTGWQPLETLAAPAFQVLGK